MHQIRMSTPEFGTKTKNTRFRTRFGPAAGARQARRTYPLRHPKQTQFLQNAHRARNFCIKTCPTQCSTIKSFSLSYSTTYRSGSAVLKSSNTAKQVPEKYFEKILENTRMTQFLRNAHRARHFCIETCPTQCSSTVSYTHLTLPTILLV